MQKRISVQELLDNFQCEVINLGNAKSRWIENSGIAKVGIEIATNVPLRYKKQTNAISLGGSELHFFKHSGVAAAKHAIKRIKKLDPPLVILNNSWNKEDVAKFAKYMGKTNITIIHMTMSSTSLYFELSPWIAKRIAPTVQVHGTLMSVYGIGVLITGPSGVGKSETAMELIKSGHLFVGDDAIEIYNFGQSVFGHASDIAKHFIEVRGLGILNASRMFGRQTTLHETEIEVVIELVEPSSQTKQLNKFERIGLQQQYETIKGVKVVKYYVPVTAGRPTTSLIESAIIDYKLKRSGYNSGKEYLDNYTRICDGKSKK